jgi:hypothetical protein
MQTCRKTQRKCTIAELIGKVGGKLEGKGKKAIGVDHHFCGVKYGAVMTGLVVICKAANNVK